jgi:hypothetical protein
MKNLLLLYLSITSIHVISGYAWSGRLDKSNDFPLLLEEDEQGSLEEDGIEYNEDKPTLVAKISHWQAPTIRGVLEKNFNPRFDLENETELKEMYTIQ